MLRVLPAEGVGLRRHERRGRAARLAAQVYAALHGLEHDPLDGGMTLHRERTIP